jgi:hypothetical protein
MLRTRKLIKQVGIISIIFFSIFLLKIKSSKEPEVISNRNNLGIEVTLDTNPSATYAITDTTPIQNKTLEVFSPNELYKIEMSGTDTNITAGGLFPYDGVNLINIETNEVIWSLGFGYYTVSFLWSDDSRYVAITGMARSRSEAYIIDTEEIKVISLPDYYQVSSFFESKNQSIEDFSYVYFSILEWVDNQTVIAKIEKEDDSDNISWTYSFNLETNEMIKLEGFQ